VATLATLLAPPPMTVTQMRFGSIRRKNTRYYTVLSYAS
jgi:hypothetical protein